MEKRIDEVCRMFGDYIMTGHSDVKLPDELLELMNEIVNDDLLPSRQINYFIQSLRREFKKPEVMNREGYGRAVCLKADYEWQPLDE